MLVYLDIIKLLYKKTKAEADILHVLVYISQAKYIIDRLIIIYYNCNSIY